MRHRLLLLCPLLLAACSSPSAPPPASSAPASSGQVTATAPATTPASTKPDSAYRLLDQPVNIVLLDKALTPNEPRSPTWETIASVSSAQYRAADHATQQKLLEEQTPVFEAAMKQAGAQRDVAWIIPHPGWGVYDATRHGYKMGDDFFLDDPTRGRVAFRPDYANGNAVAAIQASNRTVFQWLIVSDPAQVAAIEALRNQKQEPILKAYGTAQSGDNSGDPTVVVTLAKMQVLSPTGQVIANIFPAP